MLRRTARTYGLVLACAAGFLGTTYAFCAESTGDDYAVVLEVGAGGERALDTGTSQLGFSLAAEVTPIERWLELEFGVTRLAGDEGREFSVDVLFKKPFRFSQKVDFMIGMGPEVVRKSNHGVSDLSAGIELVLDFMFWPSKRVGWFLEPGYAVELGRGSERSFGGSAGVLIGW
jgi:hypothetical protein